MRISQTDRQPQPVANRLTISRLAKGRLPACKRRPFALQKTANGNAKGRLSQCERRPLRIRLKSLGGLLLQYRSVILLAVGRHLDAVDARSTSAYVDGLRLAGSLMVGDTLAPPLQRA